MDVTHPKIADYLDQITPAPDPILQEMAQRGDQRNFPYIGPQVGRLLYLLVKTTGARRIFEFGSGFGYSLYWMAQAAPADARLTGTEYKEDNIRAARDYFRRGGLADKVEIRAGEAIETFRSVEGQFDIIVLDADKRQYPEMFRLIAPRLNSGGLLVTDNVLWSGEVVEQTADPATSALQEYTRVVFADQRFHSVILPLRDGLMLSLKLTD
jgi:predicted O-methyltransferase YrrM